MTLPSERRRFGMGSVDFIRRPAHPWGRRFRVPVHFRIMPLSTCPQAKRVKTLKNMRSGWPHRSQSGFVQHPSSSRRPSNRFMKFLQALALLIACTLTAWSKPLKVYILAGQSNMEGHAKIETFDYIGDDPATAPLL